MGAGFLIAAAVPWCRSAATRTPDTGSSKLRCCTQLSRTLCGFVAANKGGTGGPSAMVACAVTFCTAAPPPHRGTCTPQWSGARPGAETAPQLACASLQRTTTSFPTVELSVAQRDAVTADAPGWSARNKHYGAPRAATAEYIRLPQRRRAAHAAADSPQTIAAVRASEGGLSAPARCTLRPHGGAPQPVRRTGLASHCGDT